MSDWTIESLVAALRARRISAVEITDKCLARIDRLNPVLRAFITVDADGARRAAKERDGELAAGRARGPLHGVPMAWKDLCASPGLPTRERSVHGVPRAADDQPIPVPVLPAPRQVQHRRVVAGGSRPRRGGAG